MTDGRLTIGQLASFAGVTPRAIRHYHERGLLPEPARDRSGYRRYDARALLDLLRIKAVADAGVPLHRVPRLLEAGPDELGRSLAMIDEALQDQIRELERRRRRILDLAAGEDAFLPPELAAWLHELRATGVGPEGIALERDGWVLLFARYPERAAGWLAEKRRHLADPEFRRLTRVYDDAAQWAPDDPRIEELAGALVAYARDHAASAEHLDERIEDPTVVRVLEAYLEDRSSPALERLHEVVAARGAQEPP